MESKVKTKLKVDSNILALINNTRKKLNGTCPLDFDKWQVTMPTNIFLVYTTPEIALEMLKRNSPNRNTNKRNSKLIREEMIMDNFIDGENSPDQIWFDTKGRLRNGQHRLEEIVNTGRSYWLEVKLNVSEEAIRVKDTGAKRTAANLLAIEGIKDPNEAAACANFIMKMEAGKYSDAAHRTQKTLVFSNTRILKWVKRHKEIHEYIIDSKRFYRQFKYLSISWMASFYYIFSEVSKDEAKLFFERLVLGTNLSKSNPIYLLREKLRQDSEEKKRQKKLIPTEKMALIILAWNYYRSGKRPGELVFDYNTMEFPTIE